MVDPNYIKYITFKSSVVISCPKPKKCLMMRHLSDRREIFSTKFSKTVIRGDFIEIIIRSFTQFLVNIQFSMKIALELLLSRGWRHIFQWNFL